jgi:hypothetical protein
MAVRARRGKKCPKHPGPATIDICIQKIERCGPKNLKLSCTESPNPYLYMLRTASPNRERLYVYDPWLGALANLRSHPDPRAVRHGVRHHPAVLHGNWFICRHLALRATAMPAPASALPFRRKPAITRNGIDRTLLWPRSQTV